MSAPGGGANRKASHWRASIPNSDAQLAVNGFQARSTSNVPSRTWTAEALKQYVEGQT
jgi:hypothetical protein